MRSLNIIPSEGRSSVKMAVGRRRPLPVCAKVSLLCRGAMRVTRLFIKNGHGEPLQSVPTIRHDQSGIWGNVTCAPFRQVLIVSEPVTAALGLKPGDLRENVVVDFDRLYDLPSGSV